MENEKLQENTAAMEQETAEAMADYEEHRCRLHGKEDYPPR